jgi:hypothetical protein
MFTQASPPRTVAVPSAAPALAGPDQGHPRRWGITAVLGVLVALTARPTIEGFDHAWQVQAGAGLAAGIALRPRPAP